jgi:acetyl-CoA carboxylase carboxyltransferase component
MTPEFDEFKARYAETLVCGVGHIHGHRIGVVANNGILFAESARKGAHFIQLCDRRGIPLLYSCKTSRASWWGRATNTGALPEMAQKW